MSRADIAKHCGELAVGAAILCRGVPAGAATGAVAAISLASLWRDMRSGSVAKARKAAVASTMDALERNGEFPDEALETTAVAACVATEDFRDGIRWDVDLNTLQTVHRMEAVLGDALRRPQATCDLSDGLIIQMAKRVSPDVRTREEAIATLDQMVEAARRIALRGKTSLEPPDFLDQVFADVARLNAEAREDEAAFALETALAEQEMAFAQQEAENAYRSTRLLEALHDQHTLRLDANGMADVLERFMRLQEATGADLYHALRQVGRETESLSRRLGMIWGLRVAVAVAARCENLAPDDERSGQSINDKGICLGVLGEQGDDLALDAAIAAFRAALEIRTSDVYPIEYAITLTNLKSALAILGQHGSEGAAQEALDAHRSALDILTPANQPEYWAAAHDNLGLLLRFNARAGDITPLYDAVTAFEAALTIRTREALPRDCSATQNNLGLVRLDLGRRGERGALVRAKAAFDDALKIRTSDA